MTKQASVPPRPSQELLDEELCRVVGRWCGFGRRGPSIGKVRRLLYLPSECGSHELSPKVGDGGNREGGISWGCLTPPLLHQRSDMPCPTIPSGRPKFWRGRRANFLD